MSTPDEKDRDLAIIQTPNASADATLNEVREVISRAFMPIVHEEEGVKPRRLDWIYFVQAAPHVIAQFMESVAYRKSEAEGTAKLDLTHPFKLEVVLMTCSSEGAVLKTHIKREQSLLTAFHENTEEQLEIWLKEWVSKLTWGCRKTFHRQKKATHFLFKLTFYMSEDGAKLSELRAMVDQIKDEQLRAKAEKAGLVLPAKPKVTLQ